MSNSSAQAPTGARKAYRRPGLVRYGRIEAVTTGGTGGAGDGAAGMGQKGKKIAFG